MTNNNKDHSERPHREGKGEQQQQQLLAEGGAASSDPACFHGNESHSDDLPADRRAHFPSILYRLLEESGANDTAHIVSWLPNGSAFTIHKPDDFMSGVLPEYFYETSYKSFLRQLNSWGFSLVTSGPNKGSYNHSRFVREDRERCLDIRWIKIKGTASLWRKSASDVAHDRQVAPVLPTSAPFTFDLSTLDRVTTTPSALQLREALPLSDSPPNPRDWHDKLGEAVELLHAAAFGIDGEPIEQQNGSFHHGLEDYAPFLIDIDYNMAEELLQ